MKRILVVAIFMLFVVNSFAQYDCNCTYPEPHKQLYMDLSLNVFMPNGSYYDTSVTPPIDLDLRESLGFGMGASYYMNDYFGMNFMALFAGVESDGYQGIPYTVYANVSILYLGAGLATRYIISNLLEIYANVGVAMATASFFYSTTPGLSPSNTDSIMTFASYIDGGVRIFPGTGTFYLLGNVRFIAAKKTIYDPYVEIGLGGLMISAGVGIAL